MHILAAGKRQAEAQARVIDAAKTIAVRLSLPAAVITGLTIQERDTMVKPIRITEATADLLEAIAEALPAEKIKTKKRSVNYGLTNKRFVGK